MSQSEQGQSKPRRAFLIINNSMVCLGGEFIYSVLNFLTSIIIARTLGNEQYGYWSFIFVYLSFFEMFTRFGLNSILAKCLSQEFTDAPKLLGNALLIRIALTVIALPAAIFGIWFLDYPGLVKSGVILGALILFLNLRSIFETLFRVKLRAFHPALWNVARAVLNLSLVFTISRGRSDILLFILASLLSGLIGMAGIAWDAYKICPISLKPDWKLIRTLVKESTPLIFSGYLTLLYYRVDVFMLSTIDGFKSVGYYSVATRLTEAFGLLSSALMLSVFPLLAKAYKDNRPDFEGLIRKTFKILFLMGFPIAIGGTLCARDIIVMLFGDTFAPSATTFAILVWFTFLGFITTFFVNVLIVCGKAVVDTWISLGLVFGNILMNLILIPRFSFNGAAMATVMVEMMGALSMSIYLVRHPLIKMPVPVNEFLTAVKVNLIFVAIILLIKQYFWVNLITFISLSAGVYGVLLFITRTVEWSDIRDYVTNGIRDIIPAYPANRQDSEL